MEKHSKPASKKDYLQKDDASVKERCNIIENLLRKVNDVVYRYELMPERKFTFVSEACLELTGYTPEDHYADKDFIFKIVHPEDHPLLEAAINSTNKENQKFNLRWYKKDGTLLWTEHHIDYDFNEAGKLQAINGIARNITRQKISKENSLEHEARYRKIFNEVFEGLLVFDRKTKVLEANPEFERITGIKREEVVGKYGFDLARKFADKSSLTALFKAIKNVLSGKPVKQLEIHFRGKALEISTATRKEDNYHIAVFRDLTEQKLTEEKLKETQENYSQIINTTSEGFWLLDKNQITVEVNDALCSILGYRKKEILGKSPLLFCDTENQKILKNEFIKISDEKHRIYELTAIHKQGREVHLTVNATTLKNRKGELKGSFAILRDVTDSIKQEKELLESQSNLKSVLESTKDSIWSVDIDYKILTVNKYFKEEFKKYFGVELKKGDRIIDFVPETEKKKWLRLYGKAFEGEFVIEEETFELEIGKNYFEIRVSPINEIDKVIGASVISTNITYRKEAEEAIKESERKYRLIAENTSDGIFTTDPEGNITYASPSYIKQLGYDKSYVLSKGKKEIYNTIHPEDRDDIFEKIYKAISNKESGLVFTFRAKKADGSYIWREDNATFNYDENGNYTGSVVISRDITYRKEMELSLKESEEKLDHAQKIGRIGSFEADLIIDEWRGSKVFCEMFGFEYGKKYSQEEFMSIIHPDDKEDMNSYFRQCIQEQKNFYYQYRSIHRKSKDVAHLQSTSSISYNKKGRPEKIFGTIQDITELKKTEKRLRESERDLKLAQEIAGIGNWSLNPEEEMPFWSEEVFKIYERDPVEGPFPLNLYKNIYSEKYYQIFSQSIRAAIEEGKPYDIELFLQLPSGNEKWIQAICKPEREKGPHGHKLHGTIQDITKQKLAEQNLITAKEKAEESDKLKSAFLANMSHEIRTPMNGILGFTDMLKEPNLSGEDQANYIKIIEKSGNRMLDTVNDLIEISKIDTGQVTVYKKDVNFNELLRIHHQFFKPEAQDKNLRLDMHLQLPNDESIIISDPIKLDSIIINLVKNAIKYTPSGNIDFGYQKKDDFLEFYVRDTGIGVPKNRQEAIFNRFEQADISDKRAFEGSGLGLAITKSYVEMLGGKIWVESEPGKGSCFYFTLPYLPTRITGPTESKTTESLQSPLSDKKMVIMVVEDEEISAHYLKKILNNKAKDILYATDGKKAIEMLKNNPDTDLILMDIKMPLLNGYETTKVIRGFNKEVKIIAQTAFALEGDREKALQAGCDDYIPKPINKKELYRIIENLFDS